MLTAVVQLLNVAYINITGHQIRRPPEIKIVTEQGTESLILNHSAPLCQCVSLTSLFGTDSEPSEKLALTTFLAILSC